MVLGDHGMCRGWNQSWLRARPSSSPLLSLQPHFVIAFYHTQSLYTLGFGIHVTHMALVHTHTWLRNWGDGEVGVSQTVEPPESLSDMWGSAGEHSVPSLTLTRQACSYPEPSRTPECYF